MLQSMVKAMHCRGVVPQGCRAYECTGGVEVKMMCLHECVSEKQAVVEKVFTSLSFVKVEIKLCKRDK